MTENQDLLRWRWHRRGQIGQRGPRASVGRIDEPPLAEAPARRFRPLLPAGASRRLSMSPPSVAVTELGADDHRGMTLRISRKGHWKGQASPSGRGLQKPPEKLRASRRPYDVGAHRPRAEGVVGWLP